MAIFLTVFELVSIALLAMTTYVGLSGKPPEWLPVALVPISDFIIGSAGFLGALGVLVTAALEYARHAITFRGLQKKHTDVISSRTEERAKLMAVILEAARNRILNRTYVAEPGVDHRLTLYRANGDQTRLEIFARSCYVTIGSTTSWPINRDQRDLCRGVAGVAWFCNAFVEKEDLPDVSGAWREVDGIKYAKETFTERDLVKENQWRARSYVALAVRCSGCPWGVVVLDSISPKIPMPKAKRSREKMMRDLVEEIGAAINAWT